MPKSKPARRKVRTPKFIEIDGHKLTQAQEADMMQAVEHRRSRLPPDQHAHAQHLGFGDFLAGYKISKTAKDQLSAICGELNQLSLAVGSIGKYPLYCCDGEARMAGCDALRRIAANVEALGMKLNHIERAVRAEEGEKLQDWMTRQRVIDAMGVQS